MVYAIEKKNPKHPTFKEKSLRKVNVLTNQTYILDNNVKNRSTGVNNTS